MNFTLKKIKQQPNGKMKLIYTVENEHGVVKEREETSSLIPHADLCESIKALAPFMAEANDLFKHRPKFKLNADQKKRLDTVEDIMSLIDSEVVASCNPTGIILKGSGESRVIKITGKHKANNTELAMNTPKISEESDLYGFEEKLFKVIDRLTEEARLYAIEEKSPQLKLAV